MELPCPLGDYKAQGDTERECAQVLADHLLKMHAKTPLPIDPDVLDPDLVGDVLGGADAKARIEAGPAKVDVEAERR